MITGSRNILILSKVIITIIGSLFKKIFGKSKIKKEEKDENLIPREKFILLINLGYDGFKSNYKIDDHFPQGEQ